MKKNIRKAYLSIGLVVLPIAVVVLFYKQSNCKPVKQRPISYDKNYVEPLDDFKNYEDSVSFKEYGMMIKRMDELGDSLAEIYNLTGENGVGWDNEAGDFRRIKIRLKNGSIIIYDNDNGGWLKVLEKTKYFDRSIADRLKLPENSTKLGLHPYGIALDMGQGNQILMLFGYQYSTDPARLLTLIYIGKNQAEMIFNKHFTLFEIRENKRGYSLIGRISSNGSYADPYEITIKNEKLTFEKLPLKKVYESQDPHIILHDAIGWGYDKQPGEFIKVELPEPQELSPVKDQVMSFYGYGAWTASMDQVKLPTQTTTLKKTSYFITIKDRLILLLGHHYGSRLPTLTMYALNPFYPISYFNIDFRLQEITEDEEAYHLLGTRENAEDPSKVYEITLTKYPMKIHFSWLKSS